MDNYEDLILRIANKSVAIRNQANELNNRLVAFERYLAELPGRTETTWDSGNAACPAITFKRKGQTWALFVEHDDQLKLLVDAPLKIKMAVVHELPNLLFATQESQDAIIQKVEQTCIEFDQWWLTLKH